MNAPDADLIARLAKAIRVQPRHLLIAAARTARLHERGTLDPARQRAIVRAAAAGLREAEDAAALLLTPIASYAQAHVADALACVWPPDA